MNEIIKNIIEIGLSNRKINLKDFLPNYPIIRGSEKIFTISWANANIYLNFNPEGLIKGLHLIELEYRKLSNNDFGFGSPSPTFKLIQALVEINSELAHELYKWINNNGGNYYIPSTKLVTREEERKKSEIEKAKIERARKEKKKKIQEKHEMVIEKQKNEKIVRENLRKLNFDEFYIEISKEDKKPIHYFEDAIYSIIENGISQDQKNKFINLLTRKWEDRYPKKLKKTIQKIENPDNQTA